MDYIFKALFRDTSLAYFVVLILMARNIYDQTQIVFKSYCSDCDTRLWAVLDCSWGRAGARDRAIASLDITFGQVWKVRICLTDSARERVKGGEREIDGKVGHLLEGCVISSRGGEQGKSKPDCLSRNKEKFWFQSMDELLELLM